LSAVKGAKDDWIVVAGRGGDLLRIEGRRRGSAAPPRRGDFRGIG
jgi:hypothetical protein